MGQVYTVDGKRDGNHNDDLTRDKEAKFAPFATTHGYCCHNEICRRQKVVTSRAKGESEGRYTDADTFT